jgi:hypothetical protein
MNQAEAENFERTIELGKELAKDLDDRDMLGHWMAHHISDLITRAQGAGPEERDLRQEATDTILALWQHRNDAPLRSRPTRHIDTVLNALQRLGSKRSFEFYNTFGSNDRPEPDELASSPALQLALELENTMQELVLRTVRLAANEAGNKEARWLQHAKHLADDDQMRLWRLLRRLDNRRRARASEENVAVEPDCDLRQIITELKRAEQRLERARVTLEESEM